MKKFLGLSIALAVVGCAAEVPPAAENGVTVETSDDLRIADDVVNPWDEPTLQDVDVYADKIIYTYDSVPARPVRVGDVVTGSEGEEGYMREVTSVTALSPTTFEVIGEQVGLERIIEEGSLKVHIDADGSEFTELDDDIGGRQDALGFSLLPTRVINGSGVCGGAGSGDITFRHDLTFNKPEFDLEFERRGFSINTVGYSVNGDAEFVGVARMAADLDVACSFDLISLLGSAVRPRLIRKRFKLLGFINITVLIKITPRFTVDATVATNDMTNEVTVTLTAKAELSGFVGYRRGSGVTADLDVPVTADVDTQLTGGNAEGRFDTEIGVAVSAAVSGLVLPTADLSANARAQISTDSLACEWNWEVAAEAIIDVSGALGIDLGWYNWDRPINFNRRASFMRSGDGTFDLPYCDSCETDDDCADGQICTDEGLCEDKPCEEDNDCNPGFMCSGGSCIPEGGDLCAAAAAGTCGECIDIPGCALCDGSCTMIDDCGDTADMFTRGFRCEGVDGGDTLGEACDTLDGCGQCLTTGGGFCGWDNAGGNCMAITDSNRGRPFSVAAVDWYTSFGACGG